MNKSGAWYAYNGDKIAQGHENATNYLRENPLICEEIDAKVRAKYMADTAPEEDAEDGDEAENTETPAEPLKGRRPAAKAGRKAGAPDDDDADTGVTDEAPDMDAEEAGPKEGAAGDL